MLRINPRVSLATIGFVVFPLTVLAQLPASASAPTSPKSLANDLVPASYLQHRGFTKVVERTTTTSKTGEKSCPNGAQEVYEDVSGQASGVESEIVACTTNKAAAALLSEVRAATPSGSSAAAPNHQLGSSAIERSDGGSSPSYGIYWQRGRLLELVVLTTDLSASSSSTTTSTTVAAPPITLTQQNTLVSLAVEQNTRL